jgi:hypothetical protein
MTKPLKLVAFALGVFFCTLVPRNTAAQTSPLMFSALVCAQPQIIPNGEFFVVGDPSRDDLAHTLGTNWPGATGMISLTAFYQGEVSPLFTFGLAFGQNPRWTVAAGTGGGGNYPEPVPAIIRVQNFFNITPNSTLTLPLVRNWAPGQCDQSPDIVVVVKIGKVDLRRYGLDAIFYVADDGRLFEDIGLTIPAN